MGYTVARNRLRAVLAGERCVTMASVWDPITARLADDLGYEAALVGGTFMSHAVLAAPDLIVLTLTELAEQVHRCARVSPVPLVVDGDHGYGNALNVIRTVNEMDDAGAGAITIEDTLLPRAFGPSDAPSLIPLDEAVGKMKAAVKARGDSDLVVMGRTSAASLTSLDDAVARFKAFESAGVDALFIPGPQQRRVVDVISEAVRLPLVVAGAPEAVCDPAYLVTRRVKAWAAGHHAFAVALQALYESLRAVKDGTLSSKLPGQAPRELVERATGAADYARWIRDFMQ
jgi:carboxyvinyl-carboxyphosphonate phosphorylmutase